VTAHQIKNRTYEVVCSCGWVYVKPDALFEMVRTNHAITKHRKETAK